MKIHNLGYPRIGIYRELKRACEAFWSGKINSDELLCKAKEIRQKNWQIQKEVGVDLIPVNDFSLYDHVLDMTLMLNAIPERFKPLSSILSGIEFYFSLARGFQKDNYDVTAMEMTKWFDTNYHYIVPEFTHNQTFELVWTKIFDEFLEAKSLGIEAKPVLLGAVTYLLLGKEKGLKSFRRIDLIDRLLPVYLEILRRLVSLGATWVQIDEPCLVMDLSQEQLDIIKNVYREIKNQIPEIKIILAGYFEGYRENLKDVLQFPIDVLHVDLARCPEQLDDLMAEKLSENLILSLGIVDGRNIWKNDLEKSLNIIERVKQKIGKDRVWIAPSCSLLHCPYDLDNETKMHSEIKEWMAFAKQKLIEASFLKMYSSGERTEELETYFTRNKQAIQKRKHSSLVHNPSVKQRINNITDEDFKRNSDFSMRQKIQKILFELPNFPTTTIGSFPQTEEIRKLRAKLKTGEISKEEYESRIENEIIDAIKFQEEIGLDVLVHGEFERNDMVEYFGELLEGYVFTENGWVQSYGSRCVKPPVIYGDVYRTKDLSVRWITFAQKYSAKPVKGMLTGPVTMLQWSFVRDDQPRSTTAFQIALAIRDEVKALEEAGIRIIQIDEPALREGLPLRKKDWPTYLDWAIKAFRLATSGVKDETQIHTHMCYSEFNDIIESIAQMDADVITIETSRSEMELLDAFVDYKYPNEIGPGVYDIHSPRIPRVDEMVNLLNKAKEVLPLENIWVNPDCGLKTRKWEETKLALINMVKAAQKMRESISEKNKTLA